MKLHVREVLDALEEIAPSRYAFSWDRIGLQVGSPTQEASVGVVCLDLTETIAKELPSHAVVVAHHPLIWDPMRSLRTDTATGRVIEILLGKKSSFIAAHTNWDAAPGGVNDALAQRLGLFHAQPFGSAETASMLKAVVYCPKGSESAILDAMSAAGAGEIGAYRRCAFLSEGRGTFIGGEGSQPVVGERGRVELVDEVRLEAVLPADRAAAVASAIRSAHPYEEPAFDFLVTHAGQGQPIGRLGDLPSVASLLDFRDLVDEKLGARSQVSGRPDLAIRKVAVVGGAAGGEWKEARRQGADVLVTGEAKHSDLVDAGHAGFPVVIAGHYATEQPGMDALARALEARTPQLKWSVATQDAGSYGATW